MDIFIAMAEFIEEPGKIYKLNVVKYREKFWLVADWKQAPSAGYAMPARAVLMENMPYQHSPDSKLAQFVLQSPISKAALQGPGSVSGYVVEESLPVFVAVPGSTQ